MSVLFSYVMVVTGIEWKTPIAPNNCELSHTSLDNKVLKATFFLLCGKWYYKAVPSRITTESAQHGACAAGNSICHCVYFGFFW